MDSHQSQSDPEGEMSFKQKISQVFSTDGNSRSHHQKLGQEGGGSLFSHHRLVMLSLVLLNVILLIASAVIGIYCAQAQDLQVPDSVATPLIIELNFLRNSSHIVRAQLEAQVALTKAKTNHAEIKLQVKQEKTRTDTIQRQIETLYTLKTDLQTNKTALEDSCGRCRPGWLLLKSSCYYFSSLHVPTTKKNWFDSRADCISRGGDLLVINNMVEQQLISNNFPKQSSSLGLWWQNGFWIGLTDAKIKGTWVWVNNVTEVETMYWRSGQPDRDGPQSGNCAAFYYYNDNMRSWYNGNCTDHLYNWICEMEPSQS